MQAMENITCMALHWPMASKRSSLKICRHGIRVVKFIQLGQPNSGTKTAHVAFNDGRCLVCRTGLFNFGVCFSPFFACSKSLDCKKQDVCGLFFASFYHLFGKMFLGALVHERKAVR